MNKYTVSIDDKTYYVCVEPQFKQIDNSNSFSEELAYDSTKTEYYHGFERSEKLDNKIYILLTVYAFLFALLCDIIKKINAFSFPKNNTQFILILTYSIFLTLDIILYALTLIQLTRLLKGVPLRRFDPIEILEKDMVSVNSKAVAKYICSRYNQCIDTNHSILEKRFNQFNNCVNCIIPIVVISVLLILISNFIL